MLHNYITYHLPILQSLLDAFNNCINCMSVLSNRSLMHQMYCSRSYINTSLASSNCNQPARAGFCFKTFIQRAITACASALLTSQFALFLFFSDSKIKNQNPIPTVSFGFFSSLCSVYIQIRT